MIRLNEPTLFENEKEFLANCIDTNWVSSNGKYVKKFERYLQKFLNIKYSQSCVNGTSALHLALKTLGVKENDEVLVPTLTFIATINVIKYCNANPVFFDSDNYFNIDSEKLIKFLNNNTIFKKGYSYNKDTGRIIKSIILVHVWGNACDIFDIVKECKKRNIKIIEDASESLGTYYKTKSNKKKYTGTIGDIGCFSFNGNKIITSGGGGMIVTSNYKYYLKTKYLSNQSKDNDLTYEHNNIGYNYNLSNLNAAVGYAQCLNLKKIIKQKNKVRNIYLKKLKNKKNIYLNPTPDYSVNNNWMNILRFREKKTLKQILNIISKLNKKNIQARPVWKLNHLQKEYKSNQKYEIKNSLHLYYTSLCLPSSSFITEKQVDYIISNL